MCTVLSLTQSRMFAQLFLFAGGKNLTHMQPAQCLWETRHSQSAATAKPVWTPVSTAPKQHTQSLSCEQPSLPCQTWSAHPKLRNLSLNPPRNAVGSTYLQLLPPEGPTNLCLAHFRDVHVKECKSKKHTGPVQERGKEVQFITHFPPVEVTSTEGRRRTFNALWVATVSYRKTVSTQRGETSCKIEGYGEFK